MCGLWDIDHSNTTLTTQIQRCDWSSGCDHVLSNVYKMSGRSVSVYTDTSASHEYLCKLIQNGHKFC